MSAAAEKVLHHLPDDPALVVKVLSMLIGKPVAVKRDVSPAKAPFAVARYEDGTGAEIALCAFDLIASASLGAALSMIPPGVAAESVRRGKLEESLAENLYEVMNVGTRFFDMESTRRCVLRGAIMPGDPIPVPMRERLSGSRERLEIAICVPGYPPGRMSLVAW